MKFNCDIYRDWRKRQRERLIDEAIVGNEEGYTFFVVLPRRVGPGDCRWLEKIHARLVWTAPLGYTLQPSREEVLSYVKLGWYRWEYTALENNK